MTHPLSLLLPIETWEQEYTRKIRAWPGASETLKNNCILRYITELESRIQYQRHFVEMLHTQNEHLCKVSNSLIEAKVESVITHMGFINGHINLKKPTD